MAGRYYECVECGDCYVDPPAVCRCGCDDFQAISSDGVFDADELGIDPEVDAERFENA